MELAFASMVGTCSFFFLISFATTIIASTDRMGKLRAPNSLWTLLCWILLTPQSAIAIGSYINYQSSLAIMIATSNSKGAEAYLEGRGVAALKGEIGLSTLKSLKNLYMHDNFSVLNISSSGGLITSAVEIGEFLNENGIDTLVAERCESACVIVALSGARLFVSSAANFGFHRGSAPASTESQLGKHLGDLATQDIIKILRRLDVPETVLKRLEQTPSDEMFYLSGTRIFELDLADYLID